MKIWLGLAGAIAASSAAIAKAPEVQYTLEPIFAGGVLTGVGVTVEFRGEQDGETIFELPDDWGGQSKLYGALTGLAFKGAAARDGDAPHKKILKHKPRARVTASYVLKQERKGEPDASVDDNYRPYIQPGYLHLIGWASFAHPAYDLRNVSAALRIKGLPAGWSFASDTEHRSGKRAGTLHAMLESVTVAGDFHVMAPKNGKAPGLRVAIRGDKWKFDRQAFADRVAAVLSEERAFWGDPDEPYLVTLLPLSSPDAGWSSIGGTGLSDAFAMFSTEEARDTGLTYVLAHEAMHTWIPRRLGKLGEPEARDYWLSEGFTDFYTYRVLARSGLWSPHDFAEMFNEMLVKYSLSPERAKPNQRIADAYWTDPLVQKLPYQRGMVFALLLEQQILKSSGGKKDFDDVVLAMRRKFGDGETPIAAEASFRETARALGLDADALLERHIFQGEPILLPADTFAACGGVTATKSPPFDRGFDFEKTMANGGVIVGVKPKHPAYAAGLRDGMTIIRREGGAPDDPTKEFVYRVKDRGVERVIRYMPHGEGLFDIQSLSLRDGLEGDALKACANALGGVN
jgi:predicted metalloprotease with PDZ domain